jgi:hypothetical protein
MVAVLDRSRRSYFVRDQECHRVAFGRGVDLCLLSESSASQTGDGRDPGQSSQNLWAVCSHLSNSEKPIAYYLKAGPIMILLGKCLCHDCYERLSEDSRFSFRGNLPGLPPESILLFQKRQPSSCFRNLPQGCPWSKMVLLWVTTTSEERGT